jgi:hypothetical protein
LLSILRFKLHTLSAHPDQTFAICSLNDNTSQELHNNTPTSRETPAITINKEKLRSYILVYDDALILDST